jgi:hypothetical protein
LQENPRAALACLFDPEMGLNINVGHFVSGKPGNFGSTDPRFDINVGHFSKLSQKYSAMTLGVACHHSVDALGFGCGPPA